MNSQICIANTYSYLYITTINQNKGYELNLTKETKWRKERRNKGDRHSAAITITAFFLKTLIMKVMEDYPIL